MVYYWSNTALNKQNRKSNICKTTQNTTILCFVEIGFNSLDVFNSSLSVTQTGLSDLHSILVSSHRENYIPFPRRKCPVLPSSPRRKEWIYLIGETRRSSLVGGFRPLWTTCLQAEWALICFHTGRRKWSGIRSAALKWIWKSVSLCPLNSGLTWTRGSNSKEVHLPYIPKFSLGQAVLRSKYGGEDHNHKFSPSPPVMRLTFWSPLIW